MAKLIPLTQGFFAIVDDEDFEKYKHIHWHANWNRPKHRRHQPSAKPFARYTNVSKPVSFYLHREILGLEKGDLRTVHFKNNNTLDCRKSNMVLLYPSQKKPVIPGTWNLKEKPSLKGKKIPPKIETLNGLLTEEELKRL